MGAEQDRVRQLASRIAQRVSQPEGEGSASAGGDELASVRRSIAELKRKLETIEEHLSHENKDTASTSREVEAVSLFSCERCSSMVSSFRFNSAMLRRTEASSSPPAEALPSPSGCETRCAIREANCRTRSCSAPI